MLCLAEVAQVAWSECLGTALFCHTVRAVTEIFQQLLNGTACRNALSIDPTDFQMCAACIWWDGTA